MLKYKIKTGKFRPTIVGATFDLLAVNVTNYVKSKSDNEDFEKKDLQHIREMLKGEHSDYTIKKKKEEYRKKPKRKISSTMAINGAKAFLKDLKGDNVSQEEFDRRSRICKTCPSYSTTSDCSVCPSAARGLNFARKLRKVFVKEKLKITCVKPGPSKGSPEKEFCSECDCSLSVMRAAKLNMFSYEADAVNNKRPDQCWIKRSSPNYVGE